MIVERLKSISEAKFRELLRKKFIRPASLEDVNGTHHTRPLYRHPKTNQYYVQISNTPLHP